MKPLAVICSNNTASPTSKVSNATSAPLLFTKKLFAVERDTLSHQGPIVVSNSNYTGRSPNDRFIVQAGQSGDDIWWGDVNRPFDPAKFDALYNRMMAFLQQRDLFVQDCFAGADKDYRLPVRVISTRAWNSLFARNMLIKADGGS